MRVKKIAKEYRKTKVGRRILVEEDVILKDLVQGSYYDFVREFWSTVVPEKFVDSWYIKMACDEIQDMMERVFAGKPKIHDLIYNQPPGTSKSTSFSIFLLPWCWTRMPTCRFIGASYAHPLALDLSRKSRDVIKSDLYQRLFPDIKLRPDQDTKAYFANTKGGFRFSVGSNGTVTGYHSHVTVIDDPINPSEAMSEIELERTNNWITGTLLSRKVSQDVSVVMTVMQRLHQNDPSAVLSQRPGVKQVVLPATTDFPVIPESLQQFYTDGLLEPVRLSKERLKEIEAQLDPYQYAGQYGQKPVPIGGGMFKTDLLRIYDICDERLVKVCRFWDKANTAGRGAYTVGVKMGIDRFNHVWVLDVVRGRWDTHVREVVIRQTAWRDGKDVWVGLEQEPGSGAKESNEMTTKRLLGHKVKSVKPSGDKEARAVPFSVQVNAGNVTLLRSPWNKDYIEELSFFPFSTWKDQVDASSGGFTLLTGARRKLGAI